jgi:hypothetical protein
VKQDTNLFFRLMLTAEVAADGQTMVKDSEKFRFSAGAHLYRYQSNSFPVPPGSVNLSSLHTPILQTADGKYTSSLSNVVSEVDKL